MVTLRSTQHDLILALRAIGRYSNFCRLTITALDTDLFQAQSILYRRLSANLYATKYAGEYFHLHGSLDATKALNMIGLEGHRPDLTEYHECIRVIEDHVKQYTVDELEEMNWRIKQAGRYFLSLPLPHTDYLYTINLRHF